jgi:hypothetical protein
MTEMTGPEEERSCPWCSTRAEPGATHCRDCGASLAQRESIGDLIVAGVTTVDPELQAYAAQPLRIPGSSASQGIAGSAMTVAATGGPLGLAAIGGLAAVVASEYLAASHAGGGDPVDLEAVGRPSEAVVQAVERLDRDGELPSGDPPKGDDSKGDSGNASGGDSTAAPEGGSQN